VTLDGSSDPGRDRDLSRDDGALDESHTNLMFDIQPLLDAWPYAPDELTARRITGPDGVDKIQMRLELGVLQMNADGRPDGERPDGFESLLEYYEHAKQCREATRGTSRPFTLSPDDCARLRHESLLYYHRYLCLFCVGDFARMARDTERNLRVSDFIRDNALLPADRASLEPYRAYVIMMNIRARAGLAAEEGRFAHARGVIEDGIQRIEEALIGGGDAEEIPTSAEIRSLRELLAELDSATPATEESAIEAALEEAIRREDYLAAAEMRDRLFDLRGRPGSRD